MYNSDSMGVSVSVISNNGNLTVNAGSIINEAGNASYGSYAIDSLTGDTWTPVVTINGGLVKSTAYRAIRLFMNSSINKNTLEVTGGTIVGGQLAIWAQSANTNANIGEIIISGGTFESTLETSDQVVRVYSTATDNYTAMEL